MIPEKFEIDGIGYATDRWGVVRQVDPAITQIYDLEYVQKRYDSIPEQVARMSFLRAGFIIGALGFVPRVVLDIGYGNGNFLDTMRLYGCDCFGYDISGYPLNHGSKEIQWNDLKIKQFDIITFWDSLEHMPDLDFLAALRTAFIAVTVPWMPFNNGDFASWKHRRPGEHLWHFTPLTLAAMMKHYGYKEKLSQSVEDAIRKSARHPNTFTAIYTKC